MVVAEGGAKLDVLCKRLYTLIEQASNSRITYVHAISSKEFYEYNR